jgi:hypothetical protein
LAQDGGAGRAENDSLSMAEDSGNGEAAWNGVFYRLVTKLQQFFFLIHLALKHTRALDVHEVRVGRLHQSLKLVGALFLFNGRVEEIDGQLVEIKGMKG